MAEHHEPTSPPPGSGEPPAPQPDTKDWTWVLERPCRECGVDTSTIDLDDVPGHIRRTAAAWQAVLTRTDVRERPAPATWSPLEYACHVRDVFRIFDHRLDRMLTEDGPHYANWDQDETALAERYDLADPTLVATELDEAATVVADRFATVEGDQWQRTGFRSDGSAFTIDTFARYFLHDPIHHLHDVGVTEY